MLPCVLFSVFLNLLFPYFVVVLIKSAYFLKDGDIEQT